MRLKFLSILLPLILLNSCGPAITQFSKKTTTMILQKAPADWTLEDCNTIINTYTAYNKEGFSEKLRKERSVSYCEVYISALPLNIPVIVALVKKEAFQRRFSMERHIERLKEYLETYTNMTVDTVTGKLICRTENGRAYKDDISFIVTFENISSPYHPIEVERAEEGFFLENQKGEFSRVTKSSGLYSDEVFLLSGQAKLTLTFSLFQDNGNELMKNQSDFENMRLVFSGLQDDPIVIGTKLD